MKTRAAMLLLTAFLMLASASAAQADAPVEADDAAALDSGPFDETVNDRLPTGVNIAICGPARRMVCGTVVDDDGNPLVVTLLLSATKSNRKLGTITATTDADGKLQTPLPSAWSRGGKLTVQFLGDDDFAPSADQATMPRVSKPKPKKPKAKRS